MLLRRITVLVLTGVLGLSLAPLAPQPLQEAASQTLLNTMAQATDKTEKPSVLPVKTTTKMGVLVYSNVNATVDASNLSEGYILVRYTGGKSVKIKLQITKKDGTTYTYNLNSAGKYETFPLTAGDGVYSVRILENISGTKYAIAYSCDVTMALRNNFLPFLYPNQYVNYIASSKVVAKAAVLTKTNRNDIEKLKTIYYYVVSNFVYDYAKAKTVSSGYLPNVDAVLAAKKGICFDYASLMASMLRSQNIPCKLVIGYTGTTYHAWINVYLENIGWVDKVIFFDGKNFSLMDPTFVSSSKSSPSILKYVSNSSNYSAKYVY